MQSGGVTPSLAKQFRTQVYGAVKIRGVLMWIGLVSGGLLVLCALAIFLSVLAPDRNPVPQSTEESNPLLKDTAPNFLEN